MTQDKERFSADIVIADDSSENLHLLVEILTKEGYQVRSASNGVQVLETIAGQRPDLILLDIMMPDMDGYEVCRRLKADERTRDVPVIFISALNEPFDKVNAFSAGGVDYITKPFQVGEVMGRVKTHLRLEELQKQLQERNTQLQREITAQEETEHTLQHRTTELSLLNRVGQMFSSSLELDQVLDTVLSEVQNLLEFYSITFWVVVPETGELACTHAQGPDTDKLINQRLSFGKGISGWVAQHGEHALVADIREDERHATHIDQRAGGVPIRSLLSLPLRARGTVIGVLNLADLQVGHFTQDDVTFLEPIASAAAIAIENAKLYQELRQANERIVSDITETTLPIVMALSEEQDFNKLLERILIGAKSICHADGGTLYLREEKHLKFAIAQNDSLNLNITASSTAGPTLPPLELYDKTTNALNIQYIAVASGLSGQTIHIPDVYAADVTPISAFLKNSDNISEEYHEQRFDFSGIKLFDQKYGYHTTSILTVAFKNYAGEVIGILQLINAQDLQTGKTIPFDSYMQHIVEILAAQAAVVLNNTLLLEQQKSLLRFENELQIGQEIQTSFLPATLLQVDGWEFAACFYPAREVAGDFYDLFTIENDSKVAFVIADVCDKGVGSALFAALIRTLFRAFMKYNPPVKNDLMEERAFALELTNDYIFQNQIQTSMFATLFAGVLHPNTGVLKYVNCGHNPPYIVGASGVQTKLKPTGPVVGAFPDVKYKVHEITLQPGESLFTFTDGLPEARNINHEFFTDDRVLQLLGQPDSSASNLLDRVDKRVHDHIASASQFDDITMLVIRRQSDLVDSSREE